MRRVRVVGEAFESKCSLRYLEEGHIPASEQVSDSKYLPAAVLTRPEVSTYSQDSRDCWGRIGIHNWIEFPAEWFTTIQGR